MDTDTRPADQESAQGLYGKYTVTNNETGEVVTACFVLRPDRDAAARKALWCYAAATEDTQLSRDIERWMQSQP